MKKGKQSRPKKSRAARKQCYLQTQQLQEEKIEEDGRLQEGTTSNATVDYNSNCNNRIPKVEVIHPQRFLEDLEEASHEWLTTQQQQYLREGNNASVSMVPIGKIPAPIVSLQSMFELCGRILSLESCLRKQQSCSLHKQQSLTGELQKCKKEWKEIISSNAKSDGELKEGCKKQAFDEFLVGSLSSKIYSHGEGDLSPMSLLNNLPSSVSRSVAWGQLASKEQEKLLLQWGKHRGRRSTPDETTEDRIVLAERLRRQLELVLDSTNAQHRTKDGKTSAGRRAPLLLTQYAKHVNSLHRR